MHDGQDQPVDDPVAGLAGGADDGAIDDPVGASADSPPDGPPHGLHDGLPPRGFSPHDRPDRRDADEPDLFDEDELRELSGYARLAARLKEAHEVLCGMDLDLPDRADFVRRLLVITAACRHDRDDALERVERFLAAVDQKRAGL